MRLKNIVIVVEDMERSITFYKELFGLEVLPELYFETYDLETFQEKLDESGHSLTYLNRLTTYEQGQKCIRFYDPDKHLIEIGEAGKQDMRVEYASNANKPIYGQIYKNSEKNKNSP